MAVNEEEIDLLERYLDDELSANETDALRKRLVVEPALSAAMVDLQNQRDMRQLYFDASRPDDASVERLVQSVRRNVNRQIVWGERLRSLRHVGSLAACLVVGLLIGRAMRPTTGTSAVPMAKVTPPSHVIQTSDIASAVGRESQNPSPITPVTFNGPLVNRSFNLTPDAGTVLARRNRLPAGYKVGLVDASGNVVRQFDSVDGLETASQEEPITAPNTQEQTHDFHFGN